MSGPPMPPKPPKPARPPKLTGPDASNAEAVYDVGFGKPPISSRFRKGQSGNPKGRPKGARNLVKDLGAERMKDIILQEAYRNITVRDGAENVTVPMAQAVLRALTVNAAKGEHRAQRLFTELLGETERANKAQHDDWLQTTIAYKVDWEHELDRRERQGIDLPPPLPHPDDIIVDFQNKSVHIKGPMSKEEKVIYDQFRARRDGFRLDRQDALKALAKATDPDQIKTIKARLAITEKILAKIDEVLGFG